MLLYSLDSGSRFWRLKISLTGQPFGVQVEVYVYSIRRDILGADEDE
jgi:hypothetical protein